MPDTTQLATYARLLRLTPVDDLGLKLASPPPDEVKQQDIHRSKRRWRHSIWSLLLLVVIPTSLAAGYFWLFAADRYLSEARFVLRTPGRSIPSASAANLLQSVGISRSNDDGYVVLEFLESRDAMKWLEARTSLREAYAEPKWDFVWRFPNPFMSNSDEGLYKQYRRMVSANFDSATGVNVLKVQAFTPKDAMNQVRILLDAAEGLVNRLNERARRDAIGVAEAEASRMRDRTVAAQSALTTFREREQLLDPSQATLAVLETIAKLANETAQVSVQINELEKSTPNGPQISPLKQRRAALEAQIATERQRLAGSSKSIAPRIVEYERLMLEREFAEKALMAALSSVELARIEALRQQVYLERVAAPSEPDYPTYPWRMVWCAVTGVLGYMAWRIWRILSRDALQHNQQ